MTHAIDRKVINMTHVLYSNQVLWRHTVALFDEIYYNLKIWTSTLAHKRVFPINLLIEFTKNWMVWMVC